MSALGLSLLSGVRVQLRQSMARATFQFVVLAQPLFLGIVTYMLFSRSGRSDYSSYVLLGTGLTTMWSSIVFSSAGDVERERYMGNLEYLMISPTEFWYVMLARVIGNTLLGLFSVCLSTVYVVLLFRVSVAVPHAGALLLALAGTAFAFAMLAQFMAGIFTLSRNARGLMNGLEYPIYLVCGLMFPLSYLPVWVRPLSYVLAPTWAFESLRLSLQTQLDGPAFFSAAGWLWGLGLIYMVGFRLLFRVIDRQTRISGSLGVH